MTCDPARSMDRSGGVLSADLGGILAGAVALRRTADPALDSVYSGRPVAGAARDRARDLLLAAGEMIQRIVIYLGAFIALVAVLVAAAVTAPALMLLNWIEERRTGQRYDK